ncbi:MAG: hypothetical protein ABW072_17280 [Sedimenticola sp.]
MDILAYRDKQLAELTALEKENARLSVQSSALKSKVNTLTDKISEFSINNIPTGKHRFDPDVLDERRRSEYERLMNEKELAVKSLSDDDKKKLDVNQRIGDLQKEMQLPADIDSDSLIRAREEVSKLNQDIAEVEAAIERSKVGESEAVDSREKIDVTGASAAVENIRADVELGRASEKDLQEALKDYEQRVREAAAHTRAIEEQKSKQTGLFRNLSKLKSDRVEALRAVDRLEIEVLKVNADADQRSLGEVFEVVKRIYGRCMGFDYLLKERGIKSGVFRNYPPDFEIPMPNGLRDQSQSGSMVRPLFSTRRDIDPVKEAEKILKAI